MAHQSSAAEAHSTPVVSGGVVDGGETDWEILSHHSGETGSGDPEEEFVEVSRADDEEIGVPGIQQRTLEPNTTSLSLASTTGSVTPALQCRKVPAGITVLDSTYDEPSLVQWTIKNSGCYPWPSTVTLRKLDGDLLFTPIDDLDGQMVQPGEVKHFHFGVKLTERRNQSIRLRLRNETENTFFGDIFTVGVRFVGSTPPAAQTASGELEVSERQKRVKQLAEEFSISPQLVRDLMAEHQDWDADRLYALLIFLTK